MRTATRLSVARWVAASRTKPSEFPQHEAKSRALGVAGPWLRAKLREREREIVRGHGRIASRWGPGKRSERREHAADAVLVMDDGAHVETRLASGTDAHVHVECSRE